MSDEQWRDIPGVPHYQVSDGGSVRSFMKKGRHLSPVSETPRVMSLRLNGQGRYSVSLPTAGPQTHKNRHVSRLVMLAFVGPCPDGHEVAHLNGVRTDNRLRNLAYVPHRENEGHKRAHGSDPAGERNGAAKLSAAIVGEIRELASSGVRQARIAERYGLSRQMVSAVVTGRTWGHIL